MNVVIGAVVHAQTLTLAVCRGNVLDAPKTFQVLDVQGAVAQLLVTCTQYPQRVGTEPPALYLEAGPLADTIAETILTYEHRPDVAVVDGLAPAASLRYANRRSELHYQFRQRVEESRLRVHADYHDQLTAFDQQEKDGKVFFESPLDVARRLGRYPARAVAAVLAAIDTPRGGGTGKSVTEWEPSDD